MAKLNTSSSIVDYLKSQGQDSSKSARAELAKQYGITNYTGSESQNVALLNAVKSGGALTSGIVAGAVKASGGGTANKANASGGGGSNTGTLTNGGSSKGASGGGSLGGVDAGTNDALQGMAGATNIIDEETMAVINSTFSGSPAYHQASALTQELLAKLTTGRTSWSDQVEAMIKQIQNREDFEYDVTQDTLFQQALSSAMQSGKTAMQDTIGQASALTGGYGSTYATSAGNQAYNAYIQDAYADLPQYYQMALEAYQMEGEDMYNQLAMLNDADAKEYERLYNAWSANHTNTQTMYQNEYGEWHDKVNTALSKAGLQIDESNALFNQKMAYAELLNTDYWKGMDYAQSEDHFTRSQAQSEDHFTRSLKQEDDHHKDEMSAKESALEWEKTLALMQEEAKGKRTEDGTVLVEPTETQMKKALEAYNSGGDDALYQYVDSLESDVDMDAIWTYVFGDEKTGKEGYGVLPLEKRTYTKTKDTTNWLWGDDDNDVVTDQYGNVYEIGELPESIRRALTKLKKGETYTAK